MKAGLLPYNSELGELGLLALSMQHEIPFVQALVESYQMTHNEDPKAKGWMFCTDDSWQEKNQIEPLFSLHTTIKQYGKQLKILIDNLDEFLPYQNIHAKLTEIKKNYFRIPFIEPELHLLKSGHGLLETPGFLENLSLYLLEIINLQSHSKTLRSILMQEVINTISLKQSEKELEKEQ